MYEEQGKDRKRRRQEGPRSSEARQRFLQWRRFVWLPGEIVEVDLSGRKRESQTDDRHEGERDEGA